MAGKASLAELLQSKAEEWRTLSRSGPPGSTPGPDGDVAAGQEGSASGAEGDLSMTLEAELFGGPGHGWEGEAAAEPGDQASGGTERLVPSSWARTDQEPDERNEVAADDILGDSWLPEDDELAAADDGLTALEDEIAGEPADLVQWDAEPGDDPDAFGPAPRGWLGRDADIDPPVRRQISRGLLAGVALVGVAAVGSAVLFASGPGADLAAEPGTVQVAALAPQEASAVGAPAAPANISEHQPTRPRSVRTVLVGGPIMDEPEDSLSAGAFPSPNLLDNRSIAGNTASTAAAAGAPTDIAELRGTPVAADAATLAAGGKPEAAEPAEFAALTPEAEPEPAATESEPETAAADPQPPPAPEDPAAPERPQVTALPGADPIAATVTTHVNMRAGPDNDAGVVRVVPAGARVNVLACEIWCQVTYEGKTGWIFRDFIKDRTG